MVTVWKAATARAPGAISRHAVGKAINWSFWPDARYAHPRSHAPVLRLIYWKGLGLLIQRWDPPWKHSHKHDVTK
jgi:hypothetical protein